MVWPLTLLSDISWKVDLKAFFFFGPGQDYTVRKYQETGQNKTKSWTCRPKATTKAEDNFIRHQLTWQKADCSQHHCTTEPISWKNDNIHWGEDFVKLTYMAELLSRNHCWGTKQCQKAQLGQSTQRLNNRAVE